MAYYTNYNNYMSIHVPAEPPLWWVPQDEKEKKKFENYKSDVKTFLTISKEGIPVRCAYRQMAEAMEEEIKYGELRFKSFGEFLYHCQDVFEVRADYTNRYFLFLKGFADEETEHLRDLVQGQSRSKSLKGYDIATRYNTRFCLPSILLQVLSRPCHLTTTVPRGAMANRGRGSHRRRPARLSTFSFGSEQSGTSYESRPVRTVGRGLLNSVIGALAPDGSSSSDDSLDGWCWSSRTDSANVKGVDKWTDDEKELPEDSGFTTPEEIQVSFRTTAAEDTRPPVGTAGEQMDTRPPVGTAAEQMDTRPSVSPASEETRPPVRTAAEVSIIPVYARADFSSGQLIKEPETIGCAASTESREMKNTTSGIQHIVSTAGAEATEMKVEKKIRIPEQFPPRALLANAVTAVSQVVPKPLLPKSVPKNSSDACHKMADEPITLAKENQGVKPKLTSSDTVPALKPWVPRTKTSVSAPTSRKLLLDGTVSSNVSLVVTQDVVDACKTKQEDNSQMKEAVEDSQAKKPGISYNQSDCRSSEEKLTGSVCGLHIERTCHKNKVPMPSDDLLTEPLTIITYKSFKATLIGADSFGFILLQLDEANIKTNFQRMEKELQEFYTNQEIHKNYQLCRENIKEGMVVVAKASNSFIRARVFEVEDADMYFVFSLEDHEFFVVSIGDLFILDERFHRPRPGAILCRLKGISSDHMMTDNVANAFEQTPLFPPDVKVTFIEDDPTYKVPILSMTLISSGKDVTDLIQEYGGHFLPRLTPDELTARKILQEQQKALLTSKKYLM